MLAIGIWAYQIPSPDRWRCSTGDLWFYRWWDSVMLISKITLPFNTTAGVYRRVCLYDAAILAFRLRFSDY